MIQTLIQPWRATVLCPPSAILKRRRPCRWKGVGCGGYNASAALSSAELYDTGLDFNASGSRRLSRSLRPRFGDGWRLPALGSGASPKVQAAILKILRRTIRFCNCAASKAGRPRSSFPQTGPLIRCLRASDRFAARLYAGTVFVNGIPSTGAVLNISVPVPTAPILTGAKKLTNGSFQFSFTNSPEPSWRTGHH